MKNHNKRRFGRAETVTACVAAVAFVLSNSVAFADNGEKGQIKVASTGNGSYVCSPAGFGQKSRCYRR